MNEPTQHPAQAGGVGRVAFGRIASSQALGNDLPAFRSPVGIERQRDRDRRDVRRHIHRRDQQIARIAQETVPRGRVVHGDGFVAALHDRREDRELERLGDGDPVPARPEQPVRRPDVVVELLILRVVVIHGPEREAGHAQRRHQTPRADGVLHRSGLERGRGLGALVEQRADRGEQSARRRPNPLPGVDAGDLVETLDRRVDEGHEADRRQHPRSAAAEVEDVPGFHGRLARGVQVAHAFLLGAVEGEFEDP